MAENEVNVYDLNVKPKMEGSQKADEDIDLSPIASTSYDAAKSGSMKNTFNVNSRLIQSVPMSQQACELQELGLTVFNQDDFEQGVMAQVDQALAEEEENRMKQMLQRELNGVLDDMKSTEQELQHIDKVMSMLTAVSELNKDAKRKLISVKKQKEYKLNQVKKLNAREKSLLAKLQVREEPVYVEDSGPGAESGASSAALNHALGFSGQNETDMERMIRLGEMTPFGTVIDDATSTQSNSQHSDFDRYILNQEKLRLKKCSSKSSRKGTGKFLKRNKLKHTNNDFRDEKDGDGNLFDAMDKRVYRPAEKDFSNIKGKKRKLYPKFSHTFSGDGELSDQDAGDMDEAEDDYYNDEDYTPDSADDADAIRVSPNKKRKGQPKLSKRSLYENSTKEFGSGPGKKTKLKKNSTTIHRDDGNLGYYRDRIRSWYAEKDEKRQECLRNGEILSDDESDLEFENGFKVPPKIWKKLFKYQKTAVRWLWELHSQQVGGIIGDEMGLGKTIQMIAFLVALKTTRNRNKGTNAKYIGLGPSLIVCPATVMHQWVKEFHTWAPQFRVAVLHGSGSYSCTEESLVAQIMRGHGVLLTSYSSLVIHQDVLLEHDWHYVILDEGHKIRNPDAQATLVCKQFRTCHRIILSGSPMQNNLKELWSLFDFIFPGKLGTLPDFMQHFSIPIVQGGYSTANDVQVKVAYKCASTLRDTINPYLLRRVKANVQASIQLPSKNEQVLFCRLTDHQRDVYKEYLESKECNQIISGNFTVFPGLITLRTICNHPDLSTGGPKVFDPSERDGTDESLAYGYYKRSGKMLVVESLLKIWKQQQHRVLMFSQSRTMLDILEQFVQDRHYSYLRMDGTTSISSRQPLIAKYNSDPTIFVFLLTTRVGGLGVNLTGADRVVIFDPDWNPSTDMQARERAWRIGQQKQVTVYRLITTGTIEEKIYHRQIFKQFLTNRVLKDPKQRRFFKSNDLYELFTLGDDDPENGTETSAIFAGTDSDVKIKPKVKVQNSEKKNKFDQMKDRQKKGQLQLPAVDLDDEPEGSDDKMSKMRELARKLSKQIAEKSTTNTKVVSSKVKNQKKTVKKSKKIKRKKKRDAVFEGETIAYLDRHDTYTPPIDDGDKDDKNAKDDDYVLKKLFKKSGVHSAMQHDTIMMSSDPDFALVESEAARVADEAVKALRQSRARCLAATSGIPTWTGQSGLAGAPQAPRARFGRKRGIPQLGTSLGDSKAKQEEPKSKEDGDHLFSGSLAGRSFSSPTKVATEAPSSSQLLAKMRARNHISVGSDTGQDIANTGEISVETKHLELITDIKNFVSVGSAINGQASTQELLDQFASRVKPSESAEFKAMLQQVCTFIRVEGVGIWRLKSEFR